MTNTAFNLNELVIKNRIKHFYNNLMQATHLILILSRFNSCCSSCLTCVWFQWRKCWSFTNVIWTYIVELNRPTRILLRSSHLWNLHPTYNNSEWAALRWPSSTGILCWWMVNVRVPWARVDHFFDFLHLSAPTLRRNQGPKQRNTTVVYIMI